MATNFRSGTYVSQLSGNAAYRAFMPNPLPFDIKPDPVLQHLLSKADMAVGRLNGIAETVPDVDFFILMYVRKEATLSSQIEGTRATFSDVLKAEAKMSDNGIHSDVDEILNYIRAMNHGLKRLESFPLSLRLIREIHAELLRGVRGAHKTPGAFRVSQNWIGGPTIAAASYVPPPHIALTRLLDNLEKFMHDKQPLPVLIKAGLIHSQFEAIHPFLDGNGRMGRLLVTFYLCQQGALRKPLLYLSEFFKRHRQDYYDKLNAVPAKDDIEGWLKFFLTGVAAVADEAVETAMKIQRLHDTDAKKVAAMGRTGDRGAKLLRALFRTPLVRIKDIERIAGISNPNALLLVRKFVASGILKEKTGFKRNRVFAYQRYIDAFEA